VFSSDRVEETDAVTLHPNRKKQRKWLALTELHYHALGVQTSRTFECAFVVAGLDRLNPLEPHHATAFGARWVFQVIDSAFHREIKARTDAQPQATINPFMIGYLRRLDRHLEFFGDAEGDLFAGLDLDRFTGRRITAHAGSTIALADSRVRRSLLARVSSSA